MVINSVRKTDHLYLLICVFKFLSESSQPTYQLTYWSQDFYRLVDFTETFLKHFLLCNLLCADESSHAEETLLHHMLIEDQSIFVIITVQSETNHSLPSHSLRSTTTD